MSESFLSSINNYFEDNEFNQSFSDDKSSFSSSMNIFQNRNEETKNPNIFEFLPFGDKKGLFNIFPLEYNAPEKSLSIKNEREFALSKKHNIEIEIKLDQDKEKEAKDLMQGEKAEKSRIGKKLKEDESGNRSKNANQLFSTSKSENGNKSTALNQSKNVLSKKRGRKPVMIDPKKIHDKMSPDNLLRKVQIHYISFLEELANVLIKSEESTKELSFIPINYGFKKNVNKNFEKCLKKLTLAKILTQAPSSKFKKCSRTSNKEIYEKISQRCPNLQIFFEKSFYLDLFENVYYKNERWISLSKYGLNKLIGLSDKIHLFQNLLDRIRKSDEENYETYRLKLKECVEKHFLNWPRFKCKNY